MQQAPEDSKVEKKVDPITAPEITPEIPEELEETFSLSLKGLDCAIVFQTDETLNVYIPKLEPGTPITKQMWLTLIVQEMLKDQSLMQLLTQRVKESPMVSTSPIDPPAESPPEEEKVETTEVSEDTD